VAAAATPCGRAWKRRRRKPRFRRERSAPCAVAAPSLRKQASLRPSAHLPQPERPPQLGVLTERGGVLTPRHTFVYEPSIEYSHTTDKNVAISCFTPGHNSRRD
jgi:hypothetical protein